MLERYPADDRNAKYEVMQKTVLSGLRRGGFFEKAAFYGGTCLKIFHGLGRWSGDMDFSLLAPDPDFNFESYFPAIISECESIGRTVEIKKKDKKTFGRVESAFLKDNTSTYDISFQTERSVKVKIEVDINPPMKFDTEQNVLLEPYPVMITCMTPPCLFAGKMHALVFRNWRNRVKGRDWYDFEWYIRNRVPLDFGHLQERIREFNGEEMSKEQFIEALKERLRSTDIAQVKADVRDFIIEPRELDIWSNDYFLQLADMIIWKENGISSNSGLKS